MLRQRQFPSSQQQRAVLPSRRPTRILASDASARVKGDYKRVFTYVANLESWPAWYPGFLSAAKTSQGQAAHAHSVGSQFAVQQQVAGIKTWTMYEVVEVGGSQAVIE